MRINRNTRRSARPVFRSVNSNRRRVMNRRRMLNSGRQRLNCAAEIGDIVDFTELNEAQQNYVVQNWYKWRELDWIREFFDENIMETYHYDVEQLAKECTEKLFNDFGVQLDINTDKIYWQSNSQGPYPEWKLSEIFDDCTVAVMGGVGDESEFVDITFANNSSYDVDKSVYFDINHIVETDPEFEYEMEYEVEPDMLAHYGLAPETTEAVHAVIDTAQYFIDTVWKYINEVCTDFPDDYYVKEELEYGVETGFQKFKVLDETTAVPEREIPDDFNTYY